MQMRIYQRTSEDCSKSQASAIQENCLVIDSIPRPPEKTVRRVPNPAGDSRDPDWWQRPSRSEHPDLLSDGNLIGFSKKTLLRGEEYEDQKPVSSIETGRLN